MTRGFEHRLWGYTVVKIKKPDVEHSTVPKSTCSAPLPSPTNSLDAQQTSEYGKVGVVDSSAEGGPILETDQSDQKKGDHRDSESEDLTARSVRECREGEEETEESERVDEWQIPETVLLTSGSIAPF